MFSLYLTITIKYNFLYLFSSIIIFITNNYSWAQNMRYKQC